jgi:hypothetical protein
MALRYGKKKSRIASAEAGARWIGKLRTASAALLLVAACAAAPTYRPPDPVAPHALVGSSSKLTLLGATSMTLREIDGKTTQRREERILPGYHLVTFLYGSGQFTGMNPCHVPVRAEAGRRYRAEVDDRNRAALVCWLRDEESGEKVEGYFGSLEPTMRGAE